MVWRLSRAVRGTRLQGSGLSWEWPGLLRIEGAWRLESGARGTGDERQHSKQDPTRPPALTVTCDLRLARGA